MAGASYDVLLIASISPRQMCVIGGGRVPWSTALGKWDAGTLVVTDVQYLTSWVAGSSIVRLSDILWHEQSGLLGHIAAQPSPLLVSGRVTMICFEESRPFLSRLSTNKCTILRWVDSVIDAYLRLDILLKSCWPLVTHIDLRLKWICFIEPVPYR